MAREMAVGYIRKCKKDGFTDEEIRHGLEKSGWTPDDIDLAFIEAKTATSEVSPVSPALPLPLRIEAQAQSIFAPDTPVISYPRPHVRKGVLVGILGALLATSALAGGGFWYFTSYYPEKVLRDGLANFKEMKSYRWSGTFEVKLRDTPQRVTGHLEPILPQPAGLFFAALVQNLSTLPESDFTFHFKIDTAGVMDVSNIEKPKYDSTVTFNTRDYLGGNIGFEHRLVDGIYYAQFTELPHLSSSIQEVITSSGLRPLETSSYVKKWVKIDPIEVGKTFEEYREHLIETNPTFANYDWTSRSEQFNDEQIKKFQELFTSIELVKWLDEPFSEKIKGASAYRYKGTLDKDAFERLVRETNKMTGGARAMQEKDLHEALGQLGDLEFNIWIAKDTHQIMKISGFTSIAGNTMDTVMNLGGVLELSADMYFEDINKTIALEVPQDARSVKPTLDYLFEELVRELEQSRVKGRDARRIADVRQLQLALELYYDAKGRYPNFLSALAPQFISELPSDPTTGKQYRYQYLGSGRYLMSAKLEDSANTALKYDARPGDQNYDVKE